jgi:uncharacterized protein
VTATDALLIFLAGLAAGTINTVVGSGSLITYTTLISLGYPPILSNVSNNIGLVPGALSGAYGYRRELAGQRDRLYRIVPASLLGGLVGSLLLLSLPSRVFARVVVALIALALVLVVCQPVLARRLAMRRTRHAVATQRIGFGLFGLVFATGIYGGYFGAAQGIILIAFLAIFINDELQRLNATKNVLAMSVNLMASTVFIVSTDVDWKIVAAIASGSAIGGQIGATVGRRLNPKALRAVIVVIGTIALIRLL